jgi:hypothetical protein
VLSWFKVFWCARLAKHHSTAMTFVFSSGNSRCRLYSCTWTARAQYTLLLLCAEFDSLPRPDQAFPDWLLFHTGSKTVSGHARTAFAPGVTQFDSFSLSQRPSPRQELHELGQKTPAQLLVEGARGIEKLATPCQEDTLRGGRIRGHGPAHLGYCASRPHFTCLEAQIGPHGWGCKK